MAENKRVVFRRVRGRIVPIKVKDRKQAGIGGAQIGLGLLGAAAGGRVSGKSASLATVIRKEGSVIKSALRRNSTGPFFLRSSFDQFANNRTKLADFSKRNSRVAIGLGFLAGTSAISKGIGNIRKSTGSEESFADTAIAAGLASTVVAGSFLSTRRKLPVRVLVRKSIKLGKKIMKANPRKGRR